MLEKQDGEEWTGLIWLRTATNGGFLSKRQRTFGFHKMFGNSWEAEQMLASQELSSIKLTIYLFSQSVSALDLLDNVSVLILRCFLKETEVMKQLMHCVHNPAMAYSIEGDDSSSNAYNLYSGGARFEFWPGNRYPGWSTCVFVSLTRQKPE
jgi:hypothetical protein